MQLKSSLEHIKMIEFAAKIASVFGIIPAYDFKLQKLKPKFLKLHALFLTITLAVLFCFTFIYHGTNQMLYKSKMSQLMRLFEELMLFGISFNAALGASFWYTDAWEVLLRIMGRSKDALLSRRLVPRIIFVYWLFETINCLLFMKNVTVILERGKRCEYYLALIFCHYVQLLTVCVIWIVVDFLNNRYRNVRNSLGDVCVFAMVKSDAIKRLREASVVYAETEILLDVFNKIFGWFLLLLYAKLVMRALLCLAAMIENDPKWLERHIGHSWEMVILNFSFTVSTMFGPIMIIFCCDATVTQRKKLLKTCCKLQEKMTPLSKEKEEVQRLQDSIESKCSTFTAANFFEIKRSLLLSLIGTITTYMIAILQFNMY